jgi:hypothetical protein
MSNYNERNPTISYRVEKKEKNHLDRVAEKKKMTVNELAKDVLSKYLKGELILAKDDQQKELTQLRIEKIKAEIQYLKIKNKFAENFNQPMSRRAEITVKPMIMGESEKSWKEWEQKTQNPQSPYDAKNKRLQCIDCGQLFTWENYEMYNIAIQEFQRHLVSKHNRVKTEIEKDVLLNLSYEGAST